MLEAQLLVPLLNCSQSVILCWKDGFPNCAAPWSHQVLDSNELFSGLPGGKVCFSWRECVPGVMFHPQLPLPCGFGSGSDLFRHHKWAELWALSSPRLFLLGEEFRWHLHWSPLQREEGNKRRTGCSYSGLRAACRHGGVCSVQWLLISLSPPHSSDLLLHWSVEVCDCFGTVTAHGMVLYLNPSVQGFLTQPQRSHLG